MEFIIQYWYIFAIVAVFLLLGLLGYILDRKKYEKYKKEIIESGGVSSITEKKETPKVSAQKKEEPAKPSE